MILFDSERKWYGLFSDNRICKKEVITKFNKHSLKYSEITNDYDVENARTYLYENILKIKIKENNKFIFGYE